MRLFKALTFSLFLLFQSCDLADQKVEPEESNQSKTDGPVENKSEEIAKPEPTKMRDPQPTPPKTQKVDPEIIEPEKPPASKPEKAAFTPDLLAAVKNWTVIPRSVFPRPAVTIKEDVKMNIYSISGQVVGSSILPAGREVVAIGHKGNLLSISPSNKGSVRGSISMDKTDFKDGVAYLFELRKMQKASLLAKKAAVKPKKISPIVPSTSSQPSKLVKKSTSLFEDLPQPGDYGHGKFCICSDCRTKRLAETGSIK
jgi:hypothetical protein